MADDTPGFTRRDFFRRMGQATAAASVLAVVDPEKLLWVPGKKAIFLPPAPEPVKLATGLDQLKTKVGDFERVFGDGSNTESIETVRRMERATGELYDAHRYIVTTNTVRAEFDSDWRIKSAHQIGKHGVRISVGEKDLKRVQRILMEGGVKPWD